MKGRKEKKIRSCWKANGWVTCLVLMLQVQKPGTCGWPLTGCQAAATFTGASCAARSWRTSGTTTTSTSPASLSVLSVVPRIHVATTCARTLNSNIPRQERLILMISWLARWHFRLRVTMTPWIRYPKDANDFSNIYTYGTLNTGVELNAYNEWMNEWMQGPRDHYITIKD